MGFRTKLVLSYMFLIALITGSFYFYFNYSLQKEMIGESRANLASQTKLARLLVMSDKRGTSPQQLAASVGTAIKARVTIIAPDGAVLGDSDVGQARLAQLENHLQRPEVQEALKNGSGTALRYSETVRTSMLYSAVTYGGSTVDGVIRLATPLEYLTSTRNALHGMVGGATAVTVLIALLFSYALSNLTSKPLRDMADAAAVEIRVLDKMPAVLPTQPADNAGIARTKNHFFHVEDHDDLAFNDIEVVHGLGRMHAGIDLPTDGQITSKSQAVKTSSTKQLQLQYERDMEFVRQWVSNLPKPVPTKHFGVFRLDVEAIMAKAERDVAALRKV